MFNVGDRVKFKAGEERFDGKVYTIKSVEHCWGEPSEDLIELEAYEPTNFWAKRFELAEENLVAKKLEYPEFPAPVDCSDMLSDPDACPDQCYYVECVDAYRATVEALIDEVNSRPEPKAALSESKPTVAVLPIPIEELKKKAFNEGVEAAARHLAAMGRRVAAREALQNKRG